MGMKPKIPKPPPVDTELMDKRAEEERKLDEERRKSLAIARTG